jgi:hypothetical protein
MNFKLKNDFQPYIKAHTDYDMPPTYSNCHVSFNNYHKWHPWSQIFDYRAFVKDQLVTPRLVIEHVARVVSNSIVMLHISYANP